MGMDELLYADFNHVQIAVRGVPFIAVRPDETERGHLFARLQAVTDIQKSDVLITDSGVKDVLCAFVLPELFVRETEGWFSGTKISHLISALISEAIRLSREHDERILLVNCSGSLAEMVLCDHGNLLFANHYHIAGPEDVLYYILAILDDFHLEALHVGVECIGPAADSVHLFLQSYLPRVGLFSFHEISPRSDFPRVESADLLCVAKCAS